jgi:putative redox protein
MKIQLNRISAPFHFEAVNEAGCRVETDSAMSGNPPKGMSPMQLLLAGAGGCSGIDIVDILSKQRLEVRDLKIEIDAERQKEVVPALWEKIHLHFKIYGNIPQEKAERAVKLSVEKYCSVLKTLEKTASISYEFSVYP